MWFQITVQVNAYEVSQYVNLIQLMYETFISPETLQTAILKITFSKLAQICWLF